MRQDGKLGCDSLRSRFIGLQYIWEAIIHFEDLSLVQYHHGPFDADSWSAPLLAVGWHENGYDFSLGRPSQGLLGKLEALIEQARVEQSQYNFRGLHHCSLCDQGSDLSPLRNSHINLFIPGHLVIYAATAATAHYVECHGYLPPKAFIAAVNDCPEYGSAAYYDALLKANHGRQIPLQSKDERST